MDVERIVQELESERDRLTRAIAALDGVRGVKRMGRPAGKRRMSAEGRRRIAEAARRRWAAWHKNKKK